MCLIIVYCINLVENLNFGWLWWLFTLRGSSGLRLSEFVQISEFFQPHEMHCKQADSAILKIRCGWNCANCEYVLFAYGLLSYSDFKQTRAFVAKRDMSQIRAFSDFFWLRFDSDNCDLTQTLLRHLSQKMVTGASVGEFIHSTNNLIIHSIKYKFVKNAVLSIVNP